MENSKEEFDKRIEAGIDLLVDDLVNSLTGEADAKNNNFDERSSSELYQIFLNNQNTQSIY